MRILLDTHVWLWWNSEPHKLSQRVLSAIADSSNEVFLSEASVWEMAIKNRIGKLPLPEPVNMYVRTRTQQDSIWELPILHSHAAATETLPMLHNDPFDRLLIAQSWIEDLLLLTADDKVLAYARNIEDARR
jgi:PIN domain nuclease of toxin-antitoxin system